MDISLSYRLVVPKENQEQYNYVKHILRDIYEFSLGDLDFIPCYRSKFEELCCEEDRNNGYHVKPRVIFDTADSYEIVFDTIKHVPLRNVIPLVDRSRIPAEDDVDQSLLREIKDTLSRLAGQWDKAMAPRNYRTTVEKLRSALHSLILDKWIDAIVETDNNIFLFPFGKSLFKAMVEDGVLRVEKERGKSFDIDDGFLGTGMTRLNSQFVLWQETKDITRPILKPYTPNPF